MGREVLIKTNIFGGFDKKQVTAYITQLQSDCDNRKTKNEIEETKRKIAVLQNILREKDEEIAKLTQKIDEVNSVETPVDSSSNQYDLLRRSAEKVEEAKAKAEEITDKLSENINEKGEGLNILYDKLSTVNNALNSLTGNLSHLSEQMEDIPFETSQADENDIPVSPVAAYDKIREAVEKKYSSDTQQVFEDVADYEPIEETRADEAEKKKHSVALDEEKLNTLFSKLMKMTDEINQVHSSISDVSEKIDKLPEASETVKEAEPAKEEFDEPEKILPEPEGETAEEEPAEEIVPEAEEDEIAEPVKDVLPESEDKAEPETVRQQVKFSYHAPYIEIIEEDPNEEKSESEDLSSDNDVYSDSKNIQINSDEAKPEPQNIEVISVDDKAEEANQNQTAKIHSPVLESFNVEIPEKENIIEATVEKFKAKENPAVSVQPKKKPAEKTEEQPANPEAETKPVEKAEPKAEEKPTEKTETKPDGAEDSKNDNGFEEELYFTLNF